MSEHRLEVADVFRTYGDHFLALWERVLSRPQRKAFDDIRNCRTAALGGHVQYYDCGHCAISYNSCLMGSNSLWRVEERLSGRSKLFSLIQAVVDGCRLPITNRPFLRLGYANSDAVIGVHVSGDFEDGGPIT